MILIISENDQIIGADEEFLNNSSLEELKENFPSMSVFLLQSENGVFDFEYNGHTYKTTKYNIITDLQNANLYVFNNIENSTIDKETKHNNSTITNLETPELSFSIGKEDTQNENNELSFNNIDSNNQMGENKNNLSIDLNSNEHQTEEELSFELGISEQPNETKDEPQELSLDLGISTQPNETKDEHQELSLDLDISEQPNEIKDEPQELSLDLGISEQPNETKDEPQELSLDIGISEQPNETKDEPQELSLDLGISEQPNETKDEPQELSLDIGISEQPNETKDEPQELSLDIGISEQPNETKDEPQELSLDLGISTQPNETKDEPQELSLDLGISEQPNETKDEPQELSLDLGISEQPNETKDEPQELSLDLDISEQPNDDVSISEEEIQKDLEQASLDLGIDNETLQQFFIDFKQQLQDEKNIFFDAINNNDYDTLHKSAHKLKGVALNLRLNKFAELLKRADDLSKENKGIEQIKSIIENIYSVIDSNEENTNQTHINIELEISNDEKNILLKSLHQLLNDIKSNDISTIKAEIKNAYKLIPIKELLEIEKLDDNEIIDFIENLNKNIEKEIK